MKIKIIAATDQKNAIGKNGSLLFKIQEDLKLFKTLTTGNIVLMGRKTYESIGKKPLKERINIVLSTTESFEAENLITFGNLETAVEYCSSTYPDKDLYIIGGGKVYEQGLKYANQIILTVYSKEYEGADTYFPSYAGLNFKTVEILMEGENEGAEFKTFLLEKSDAKHR